MPAKLLLYLEGIREDKVKGGSLEDVTLMDSQPIQLKQNLFF